MDMRWVGTDLLRLYNQSFESLFRFRIFEAKYPSETNETNLIALIVCGRTEREKKKYPKSISGPRVTLNSLK